MQILREKVAEDPDNRALAPILEMYRGRPDVPIAVFHMFGDSNSPDFVPLTCRLIIALELDSVALLTDAYMRKAVDEDDAGSTIRGELQVRHAAGDLSITEVLTATVVGRDGTVDGAHQTYTVVGGELVLGEEIAQVKCAGGYIVESFQEAFAAGSITEAGRRSGHEDWQAVVRETGARLLELAIARGNALIALQDAEFYSDPSDPFRDVLPC